MTIGGRLGAARARWAALFVEREIYMRAGGRVRFVRITRGVQQRVAAVVGLALGAWAIATVAMLALQLRSAGEQGALTAAQAAVARDRAAIAAYRRGSGGVMDDLQRRQSLIEALVTTRLGAPAPAATASPEPVKTSALPTGQTLAALIAKQDQFALRMAAAFEARSRAAAATLNGLGLNVAALDDHARARGGPLLPWPPGTGNGGRLPPALDRLAGAVERWSLLQDNLVALPSTLPTDGTMVTSSYGIRRDPFTGGAAFHAGLDFTGSYGQPIRAAAPGRVSFTGGRAGYGNVVEVEHGNGLMTRYAHLSGIDVRPDAVVARGQAIARMGSTGRSTGTHLHFEVRVGGNPANPRRFLALAQEVADVH